MPARPTSDPRQFVQAAPVLHVPDVLASAAYYRDVLGFAWDFGDADYAVVWRDNAAVHLVRGEQPPRGVHLFLWVEDVDALYRELVARGVDAPAAPLDRPYGLREFEVRDRDGTLLVFGQDVHPRP